MHDELLADLYVDPEMVLDSNKTMDVLAMLDATQQSVVDDDD